MSISGNRAGARAAAALAAALAIACGGCTVGPDFRRPDPPPGDRVVAAPVAAPAAASPAGAAAGNAAQRFDAALDVPAQWWSRFGSPALDAQVARALAGSPTLQSARQSLAAGEELLRAGQGVFWPQVGASVALERARTVQPSGGRPAGVGPYTLATAGITVGFDPDLFGRQRRVVEGLQAGVDLRNAELRAAYVGLTANVVNALVARAGYRAQRDALADVVALQERQIHIAQVQFDAGTAAYTAVVALKSQQAGNAAAIAALDQRIDQATHLLALLEGQAPADAAPPAVALDDLQLPPELPDALPSALARHRPDILAAEAGLHAASAQVGVATADLFPDLSISAGGGAAHGSVARLLDSGIAFWSAQAQLAAPVFAGGTKWHARQAAISSYQQALADYRQVVLAALAQVADTMTALGHDAAALRAQQDSLDAADEGLRLTRAAYEAGTAGYLELLNADAQVQSARLALAGARAQRLQDTVALYAALGGGWWNER